MDYSITKGNELLRGLYPNLPGAELTPEQDAIIRRILKGKDTLNVLPTGAGKSACYLIAGMLLEGVTVVVTPLLSLMQDQVDKIYGQVPTACLSSSLILDGDQFYDYSEEEVRDEIPSKRTARNRIFKKQVRTEAELGTGKYRFLYVTPERLSNGHFYRFARRTKISLLVVDEAHCISLWGYSFRPSYFKIPQFLKRIGQRPVIAAFTATATAPIKRDIIDYLGLRGKAAAPEAGKSGTAPLLKPREELTFEVRRAEGPGKPEENGETTLAEAERHRKLEILHYVQANADQCGIIYCQTVREVNYYYTFLKRQGIAVGRYYAGLDKRLQQEQETEGPGEEESRKNNWNSFLNGPTKVMVSTNALGMGVDKRDIAYVLHVGMPLCLENYYQEAGRAGRSGNPGRCVIFYIPGEDRRVCERLIRYSLMGTELTDEQKQVKRELDLKRLERMERYCEEALASENKDPQSLIVDYFNHYDEYNGTGSIDPAAAERIHAELTEKSRRIDLLYVNRTNIAGHLRKGCMKGRVLVSKAAPEHPNLYASYEASCENPEDHLTYLDLMIADAVYTMITCGEKRIYALNIMRLLAGRELKTINTVTKEAIEKSIEKMMGTRITIDRRESRQVGFAYPDQRGDILQGAFLPLKKEQKGYSVIEGMTPPLYEYAEIMNGQFYSFSLYEVEIRRYALSGNGLYLNEEMKTGIKDKKQGTAEEEEKAEEERRRRFLKEEKYEYISSYLQTAALKHYLLTKIDMVKSNRHLPKKIRLDDLYHWLDYSASQYGKCRENIDIILTDLLHKRVIPYYQILEEEIAMEVYSHKAQDL